MSGRFSPSQLALAYIALSALALAMFALPLWYGWHSTIGSFRTFVSAEMEALPDLFRREGAAAVSATVRSRWSAMPDGEVVVFAGPDKEVLAGTLRDWPAVVPDTSGTFALMIDAGGVSPMRIIGSHVILPGGYHLLMGRESLRFPLLMARFWYGLAAALAIVFALGAALAWVLARRMNATRRSEERYARAMDGSDAGHWDWNIVSDEMFVSERAREMLALPAGPLPALRAQIMALVPMHPDDRAAMAEAVKAGVQSGVHERDYRVLPPAGEMRWLRSRAKVYRDAGGAVVGMTGSLIDITERKLAADALRASEERYGVAMEASEAGFVDANVDTDEFFTSDRLNEIFGIAPGTRFKDRSDFLRYFRFHGDDGELYHQTMRSVAAPGGPDRYQFDFRIVLPSGEVRWLWTRGNVTRDAEGRARRRVGVVADVTARKLAEEGLRESQERYARAMEATEAGHWEWDLVTHQVFHSPRFRELYGIGLDEKFADRNAWKARQPLTTAERERQERALQAAIADPSKTYDIELSFELRPGVVRWLRSRAKVFRDADGRALRVTGATTDITVQKLAQEALRRSEERYALAMEAAGDGHTDWNLPSGEFYISPRLLGILGYAPDTTFTGRADWVRRFPFHPEDRKRWEAAVAAHFAGREAKFRMDLRIVVKREMREEIRWVAFTFIATRDAAGQVVRWTGSIADINDAKRAQDALRVSEERYALALEVAEEGHLDWNVQSDEFFASAQARRVLNVPPDAELRTRDDVMGRVPYHPEDRPRVSAAWRASLAGREVEHELDYRIVRQKETRDEPRWIHARWSVFRDADGKARRVIGVVNDITDRKQAAETLRLSESRFRTLVQLNSNGFWVQDENLRYVSSPLTSDVGGYDRHAMEGKTRWELPGDPVPLSSSWEAHRADLAAHRPFREFEYRRTKPDGEVGYYSASGVPIFDQHGGFKGYYGVADDITNRKRAEEELRESEARFRALTELSSDAYWAQDENLRFVATGQNTDLAGLPSDANDGKMRWELSDATPLSGTWADHEAVLRAHKPFREFEYRRLGPDGAARYLSISGAPMFDEHGTFRGYQGVGRDITDRKRGEEELRVSEARFRSLVELSSDWYWKQDENLRFVSYVPPEVGTRSGVTSAASLGKQRWEFADITPLSSSWEEHKAALRARRPFRDFEYVRLDESGTPHYTSISGVPTFDAEGRFTGYEGVGTNVSERKRFEAELRSRQEMLDLAQKSARAIAFEWKLGAGEGENRWSPDLEAMYGFAPGAYDGSFEAWKKVVHAEDWPAVRDAIQHAERTGDVDAEYRVVHADGAARWLHAKGRMFFGAGGKPVRMVGFMQDVTDRRQAQEEFRRMERQLRQAQRLEAMGTLAGGIAHDFNNILGAILGYGEMALRDAPKASRLRRDLDSIVVAGERGRALVDRVLAFSRSGVGERVPVHVEKVVREALDLLSAKLPASVTLHAKLHAGAAAMLGDATQVHQVLMNLATNAIHAMPAGGRLRVQLDAVPVDTPRVAAIGTLSAADYLVLKVADTGTGIAPEIMERIFDPFFTTKEVGTGTGLGLSLVHGIVTELGGAIDVATTLGAGSVFTVYLPRAGDALDAVEKEESEMPRGEGQRVLVVDDEEPLVRLATRTLEELGYAPVGFTSSIAALAAFRADPKRFDALITDERMPGLSGSALIREVRGIRNHIPIVLMSGFVGGAVTRQARDAGAEEVLKKPLSARDLAASLARVLA